MRWYSSSLLVVLIAAGCVTRTVETTEQLSEPDIAPALVVERFLRAVNASDLTTMARLFGTGEGSVLERDPRAQVEQRMFTLAQVLRHDDYDLEGERIAPGRLGRAIQIIVQMHLGNRIVPVPFTVVQAEDDAWLIEKIDIERITSRSG